MRRRIPKCWQVVQTALLVACLLGAGQAQGLIVCVDACGHMALELFCADEVASAGLDEAHHEVADHTENVPCGGTCGSCVDVDLSQDVRLPETRDDGVPTQWAVAHVSFTIPGTPEFLSHTLPSNNDCCRTSPPAPAILRI